MKISLLFLSALLIAYCQSRDYEPQSYESFWKLLDDLKKEPLYQKLFRVTDGFEAHKIHSVPMCGTARCKNPIIEITDFEQSSNLDKLPAVLLVAGFHGNEVTGTYALYYLIEFIRGYYYTKPYLIQLLKQVRLILVPMANVNGFYNRKREETVVEEGKSKEVDPNRDFPFNQSAAGRCFETSTALLIDALFKENVIVGALTFHGGANSITYPWGNFAHKKHPQTNDHLAFSNVAALLQKAAWENKQLGIKTYDVGTMHKVVYDVNGGFEDWAYGASFDTENVSSTCHVNKGIKSDANNKIAYPNQTNRAFVYLIEAGKKRPPASALGEDTGLVKESFADTKWGHVSRNILVSLNFAKIVNPFVVIKSLAYKKNKLQLDLYVFGCLNINSISLKDHPSKITQKKHHPAQVEYKVSLEVSLSDKVYDELEIELTCDQDWANSQYGSPESHLVRLRTQEDYEINYQKFNIKAHKIIRTKLLNVWTKLIDKAAVQSAKQGVFSLSYQNQFSPLSAGNDGSQFIRYKNGSVQTIKQKGKTVVKGKVTTLMLGTAASKPNRGVKSAKMQRKLISAKGDGHFSISSEGLFELIGSPIFIQTKNNRVKARNRIYMPGVINLREENQNALFISDEGVGCGLGDNQRTASDKECLLMIRPEFRDSKLTVNLFIPENSASRFKVSHFEDSLALIKTIENGRRQISHYQTQLSDLTLNDYRLLGRRMIIYNTAGKRLFTCRLRKLNPDEDSAREFGFRKRDEIVRSRYSISPFAILLVLGAVGASVYFWVRKRNQQIVPENNDHLKSAVIVD